MKTLLIVDKDETRDGIFRHLSTRGSEFIHYRNPVKAMDNLEEVDPDLIFFSAEDFPRHWKPFIKLLRAYKEKDQAVFILLKGEQFSYDEGTKASVLQVNGIVRETLYDPQVVRQLDEILARYAFLQDDRSARRYMGRAAKEIEFIFTHPKSLRLITGSVTDASLGGLSIRPDAPQFVTDIMEGTVLEGGSLRLREAFYSVKIKVVRNVGSSLGFKFLDLPEEIQMSLMSFFHSVSVI